MTATLKKDLGKAGAFLGDESGGYAHQLLRDVLVELAQGSAGSVDAYQATIATAIIGGKLVNRAGKLKGLRTSVGTCGTANSTTVQVKVNGTSKGELITAHDAADGIKQSLALDVALAAGDLVTLVVSAAPTAGADLVASAVLTSDVTVEA